jgi:ubiquinone/menaquinone biosynthesis C-methylase UbiE
MKEPVKIIKHKEKIEHLYENSRYKNAIDPWTSFFAQSEDDVVYSNWRYLNKKRQSIENAIWKEWLKDGISILEIGCGKGYFLKRINDYLQKEIKYYGLDISLRVINIAKDYFPLAHYVVSSGEDLPFQDNYFDYIQIIATLEHVVSPGRVINEAVRVLKPDGILYIVIHKRAIDPLIFPTYYQRVRNRLKKIFDRKKTTKNVSYSLKLSDCRREVFDSLRTNRVVFIKKGFLVGHIDSSFYKGMGLSSNWYINLARLANILPFGVFKDLEYYLYRKERL